MVHADSARAVAGWAERPRRRRAWRAGRLLPGAILLALLTACSSLPADYPRIPSNLLTGTDTETRLGRAVSPLLREHPHQSAFRPLATGLDAFVARVAFADVADRSIDLQYYLYHDDLAGRALTARLLEAADRGVRVRVLLDDMDMNGRDEGLASLALHPNIEIRLFNPFPSRTLRYVNFLTHFGTVTRRMHNKAFIVDNQLAIVGGRNIGDEYFDAARDTNFGDMDVLAAGPIVHEVSEVFDLYWNNELAYPVEALGARGDPELLQAARRRLAQQVEAVANSRYGRRLRESTLAAELQSGVLDFYWAPAELLYDLPEKVLSDPDDRSTHLGPELEELLRSSQRQITLVSPYFVPGKSGLRLLLELAARDVRVTVITNSLASTDVPAVHSGYVRYRRRLLGAGVELYETRPAPTLNGDEESRPGSSQASLHAKTFAIDGERVLVGSMNLDPRSDLLNTEMGILIESPELAQKLETWRETDLPHQAWRLDLTSPQDRSRPKLRWLAEEAGGATEMSGREPEASFWRRISAAFLRLLPIERQL